MTDHVHQPTEPVKGPPPRGSMPPAPTQNRPSDLPDSEAVRAWEERVNSQPIAHADPTWVERLADAAIADRERGWREDREELERLRGMLRLAWERHPFIAEEDGEPHAATFDTFLRFYDRARTQGES
jgi:hypothetical protein